VSDLKASIEQLRSSEAYRTATESAGADAESVVGARKQAFLQKLRELKRRQRARF
jgi:hypothetical protein